MLPQTLEIKYERFFLILNDWAGRKEKSYSSLPKSRHGHASIENAKEAPFLQINK